ncbi:peptidase domain-containing ABC transporter [Chamaesiphon sp. GL140_3_metabinner_50]|uniref:peptidase domain-containing ABC transporter n=1 Tax=Chamaesiphon sp. GL140_3_metabinner_50 TaxID=2970812 RepID=UPI0025EDAEBE|nr:peptidase domain-containing ABC transporter [Chamaesiphon sp. GL140_3_metabinner_50]
MNSTRTKIHDFFASLLPFAQLSKAELADLADKSEFNRYRMGQTVLMREQMPGEIIIVFSGQIRLLAYHPQHQTPTTLQLLEKGEILGWAGIVRNRPCETAIASTEAVCINIPVDYFRTLIDRTPQLEALFYYGTPTIEVYDLVAQYLQTRPDSDLLLRSFGVKDLREFALKLAPQTNILNLSPGKLRVSELDPRSWLVSSGEISGHPVGSCIDPQDYPANSILTISKPQIARLVGVPLLAVLDDVTGNFTTNFTTGVSEFSPTRLGIPYAPDRPVAGDAIDNDPPTGKRVKYPIFKGRGALDGTTACLKMLCKYLQVPFRPDVVGRLLKNQIGSSGSVPLQLCGAIAEMLGINSQMVKIPATAIRKLQTPILIPWQDSFAIVYQITPKELTLGIPASGLRRLKHTTFAELWGDVGEVLLLQRSKDTPVEKFGIKWFIPAIQKHKGVLTEVLIASLFVQVFGLANPLLTQLIIDKVINGNSITSLNTFGTLLIVLAIVEGILTTLRTNLFVDTTNRIDLSLGAEIIDHLFRLPLKYFEKRPVGELATRINELENIRQFLTGTALTVVLDAIFSVVYIGVMLAYSWLLTIIALATLPAFILLTWIVSPIVRGQLRTKAERNAESQSYLVEVIGGIQTIKAQNIELRSRWQWQAKYARYVSAGFKTALTSNTAGSISGFLNKFSGLLLLWVGTYLVLAKQLTLGELIAFRIIAGYTTQPLLRLVQLWQNFQETALSLERLSDILDTPQEVGADNINNITMPPIQGHVKIENLTFSFPGTNVNQLNNISAEFQAGQFVGIVGLSGSGKSTLMKLIPRLYQINSGRIVIDKYDITKTELYSYRQQIGMILQDTLLFSGTVQENIALTNPDATSEDVIAAAKVAAAHNFIMELPDGYNTKVGERGSALSGGQRQRIAIARTVLQQPRMLILDEATSALDYDSERQVCLNLAQTFQHQTVFFITHRLNTIKTADVIVMMDKGSIVETGTHRQLMALKGRYYCLYQQQESQL